MLTAPVHRQGSDGRPDVAHANETELDARFERRLDLWLSTYRVSIGAAAFALVAVLLPEMLWVVALGAAYLVAGAAVFPALRLVRTSASGKLAVRMAILLVDVLTVSVLTYQWGAFGSPAVFMYVPVVVGWALLPQRALGRLALALVVSTLGTLLWFDHPERHVTTMLSWTSVAGRTVFFGLIASALVAVHELLSYTVAQVREHSRFVSTLLAERRARERAAEWAAQLEETQRLEALGRLAGGVAHDFNNLLTALIGSAELAELALRSDPSAAQRELRNIKQAAERVSALTAQLLEFARRRPGQPRELDLRRAVETTAELLRRLLPATVRLQLELSPESCWVRLDPSSLERLLLNLCVNAADAMPEGGTLSIVLACATDGTGKALLEVRDTGIGIAAEDMPYLFEPFFTRKPRGRGTGLGLSSVYGIVRQSHGEIEVTSKKGVGTRFRISWPRVSPSLEPAEPPLRPTQPGEGTIVLVDDEPAVRTVIEEHLRSAGYHVVSAASGGEALTLFERGTRADLLLTDVLMPGMSGIELVQALRDRGSGIPVLLISGYADELDKIRAREDLRVDFFAKPFTRESLIAQVGAVLDRHLAPASGERRLGGGVYGAARRRFP